MFDHYLLSDAVAATFLLLFQLFEVLTSPHRRLSFRLCAIDAFYLLSDPRSFFRNFRLIADGGTSLISL